MHTAFHEMTKKWSEYVRADHLTKLITRPHSA